MNNNHIVSIVIPVKNGMPHMSETLGSVNKQTYKFIEIIVVDDGSTDDTVSFIKLNYPNVFLIQNTSGNHGAPVCRNIGTNHAMGEFIIFLDADDLLHPDCVQQRVSAFTDNMNLDFIVFQCELFKNTVGDLGVYWNYFSDENDLDRFIRVDTPWHTSSPIWKKQSIIKINGWDESAISWQDWEFHIRAIAYGLNYIKVPIVNSYYRKFVEGSISSLDNTIERKLYFALLYKKIIGYLRDYRCDTLMRQNYLLGMFFKLAYLCIIENTVTDSIYILKVAVRSGLLDSKRFYISFFSIFAYAKYNNRLTRKLAWLSLPEMYFYSASSRSFLQCSETLVEK
ncbi:glycosyltransferase family 2 protein [Methylocucumis oryzae]|uniref:glycosyltransferase family 2 protein n=1 Tax=Methylocucumis oryzae TaxID=1632867 RepID=UPI000696B594|nr:glycosyltransferase family 2 protein [Methylocucumis oryzae]